MEISIINMLLSTAVGFLFLLYTMLYNESSILKSPNPYYNNSEKPEDWLAMKDRMKRQMDVTCMKYGASLNFSAPKQNVLYDKEHNILFCVNLKVGSTTMMSHLYKLTPESNSPSSGSVRAVVNKYFNLNESDPDTRTLAQSAISFSIVRHPFERFLSAYRNKFIRQNPDRASLMWTDYHQHFTNITFPNFVEYFVSFAVANCTNLQGTTYPDCGLDPHWTPYIARCGYCATNYTVTVQLESLKEDLFYIGKMAGVSAFMLSLRIRKKTTVEVKVLLALQKKCLEV